MISRDRIENSQNIKETGTLLEYEFFGQVSKLKNASLMTGVFVSKKYPNLSGQDYADMVLKNRDKFSNKFDVNDAKENYISWKKAMQIVEASQLGDQENPSKFFANNLYKAIWKKLNLTDGSKLKFFTAVGSSLDYLHDIDSYFKLYGPDEKEVASATINISKIDERQETGKKAEILMYIADAKKDLYDPSSDNFDKAALDEIIEEYSSLVADLLEAKKQSVQN